MQHQRHHDWLDGNSWNDRNSRNHVGYKHQQQHYSKRDVGYGSESLPAGINAAFNGINHHDAIFDNSGNHDNEASAVVSF